MGAVHVQCMSACLQQVPYVTAWQETVQCRTKVCKFCNQWGPEETANVVSPVWTLLHANHVP